MNDEEVTLLWPERPACHDHDPFAQSFDTTSWRPARDDRGGFRTCSFCGSIHPEDLYSALLAGATLHGADWKYGWPHKFYVNNVPNSNVGKLSYTGGHSYGHGIQQPDIEEQRRMLKPGGRLEERWEGGLLVGVDRYDPQSATTRAKWYNTHLHDLNDTAFSAMSSLLMRHSNIQFVRESEGKLKYLAPRAGYQKA